MYGQQDIFSRINEDDNIVIIQGIAACLPYIMYNIMF